MDGSEARSMGPAEVMALIRASAQKGFTGAAPLAPQDATFRRARLEEVRRIDPSAVMLDDGTAGAEPGMGGAVLGGEVLAADAVEVTPAPVVEDPARRLAEARSEGYAAGRADGIEEGRAEGRAAALAEAEAGLVPARDAFVAALAGLTGGADAAGNMAEVIGQAVRKLAAERAGQMIDALPAAFAARVEAMADRVAQGVRAVSVRLHPADLAAITPHLAGCEVAGAATLMADDRLARGDVEVRAEGITLADLLEARA
ncbi:FliH/SctL family protein [Paragemmobacter ruber]|uniref:Flagellar assembly protein FliH n=1 Tax=Paragemmobacter ruber TaxID=1985673 RepID=A0ABW9Y974_9RHOB|nr:FliH/SctL family protein [Rhodobacter ruber]NBE09141.1 flagellar assembly protein FliH [Rhodobacter ruber]